MFGLWDFCSLAGRNLLRDWAEGENLSARDRAVLDQKLDRLSQIDFGLARGTNLLHGPVNKKLHIYKIRAMGDKAMRPLLCRGPLAVEEEYTLLEGALERDGKWDPRDAPDRAAANWDVCRKPGRRTVHERFKAGTEGKAERIG